MRFSTKGRYAVSAMLHLAVHNEAGPVPLAEISVCQSISLSYVDQIFARLRKAGLVQGMPGPGGGYRLARPAEDIRIGEVYFAVDETNARRANRDDALNEAVWQDLGAAIESFLNDMSLADFARRPEIRDALLQQYRKDVWRCGVCGAISERRELHA